MNILSKEDALLFHKLMNSLLFYVNKKVGIIKNANNLRKSGKFPENSEFLTVDT